MSYKFINPGYYTLFSSWIGNNQITNDYTGNPLNGIGVKNMTLRYIVPNDSTLLFCAFGYYVTDGWREFRTFNVTLNELDFAFDSLDNYCNVTINEGKFVFYNKLEKNFYNRLLLKLDIVHGSIDIWINGEQLYSQIGLNVIMEWDNFKDKMLVIKGVNNNLFSNFIISDEVIQPNEDVLMLSTESIESSVAPNADGSYTFTEAGQQFLLKPNIDALSADDIVSGIAAIGYPGYSANDGLYHVVGIAQDASGNISEYGTDAVPSDTLAASGVSNSINMTKAVFDTYKFGLRASK